MYDLIARRVDLKSYFKILKSKSKNYSTQASKLLSQLNFNEFILFFIKCVNNKDIVGKLLSQNRISIPLFWEVNKKFEYYPELLKNVLGINSYSLILNIGSPQTSKYGKTKLLSSIFSLDKKNSH